MSPIPFSQLPSPEAKQPHHYYQLLCILGSLCTSIYVYLPEGWKCNIKCKSDHTIPSPKTLQCLPTTFRIRYSLQRPTIPPSGPTCFSSRTGIQPHRPPLSSQSAKLFLPQGHVAIAPLIWDTLPLTCEWLALPGFVSV